MSGLVTVVLMAPRYFMIAGIAVLALTLLGSDVRQQGGIDLEQILPIVIRDFVPVGLSGLVIGRVASGFYVDFCWGRSMLRQRIW